MTLPLIVITGPTASGKSGLAMELAQRYGGEIICADSRTIYRGMDIGTAKPTAADQALVRHHLLNVAEPGQKFTAADFKVMAEAAIDDIRRRGHIPFLVGGTGLYVDGVVLDYKFGAPADEQQRERLMALRVDQLQRLINEGQLPLPENPLNKRQLVRVLEQQGINNDRRSHPRDDAIAVAITTENHNLEQRIRQRAEQMFQSGVLDEARRLAASYGWESEAMTGNIYPLLRQVIDGEMTEQQAIDRFVVLDRRLAKRQLTWLRRHDYVEWLELHQARQYLSDRLDHRASLGDVLG